MKKIVVGDVVLGEGIPKICVPIVGMTREDICHSLEQLKMASYDLVEWRLDWFEEATDLSVVVAMAKEIKSQIHGPLLVTFRSKREGGQREISFEEYHQLNLALAESGEADLVDVEFASGRMARNHLIAELKRRGVKVICSSHDFEKTPESSRMMQRLFQMKETGADVVKLAVMPRKKQDVLRLLSVTEEADRLLDCPIITMSMGPMGGISRMMGEYFGSCVTFGSAGEVSAPGQMDSKELQEILMKLHQTLQ